MNEVIIEGKPYRKAPYAPPELGNLYCVRDKSQTERVIRITGKSHGGDSVEIETLGHSAPSKPAIRLRVDALARQAAKGWCSLLLPVAEATEIAAAETFAVKIGLDIQNFSRCCADIVRANIKFDTQLIKDVGDGPFRAGKYDDAFRKFEQFTIGFGSAVAASRRAIADGRRALMAEKGRLSGKEIEERKAAYIRSEQLIGAAERAFSTILEGLRTYLRAQQGA